MSKNTLLTALFLAASCVCAVFAQEGAARQENGGIISSDEALARKNGVHEAILNLAAKKSVPPAELPAFYSAQARTAADWFDLYFKTAEDSSRDPRAALKKWAEKTSAAPRDADAWFLRAVTEERSGDIRAAVESYSRSLELDPAGRWGMAYSLRGLLKKDLQEPAAAAADLDAAIAASPSNPFFYHARASLGVEQGNYPAASRDLSRFFELNVDTAAAQSASRAIECEELAAMGFSVPGCSQAKDQSAGAPRRPASGPGLTGHETFAPWEYENQSEKNELALYIYDALDSARNLVRANSPVSERAGAFLRAGDTALISLSDAKHSLKAALKLYELSLFISPSAKGYLKRGTALLELGRLYQHAQSVSLALADFDRAAALGSDGVKDWAYLMRARAKAAAGDTDGALSAAAPAARAGPGLACFPHVRAEILAARKDFRAAAGDMEKFLKLSGASSSSPAKDRLCGLLARNGFAPGNCSADDSGGAEIPFPPCYPPLELITDPL